MTSNIALLVPLSFVYALGFFATLLSAIMMAIFGESMCMCLREAIKFTTILGSDEHLIQISTLLSRQSPSHLNFPLLQALDSLNKLVLP